MRTDFYLHFVDGKWKITRRPSALGPYKQFRARHIVRQLIRTASQPLAMQERKAS